MHLKSVEIVIKNFINLTRSVVILRKNKKSYIIVKINL